ncbi:hypothetical protein [uncultured Bacteroides sp.]|nr:hypothetical protein [uncultured Bacteroides sp.]
MIPINTVSEPVKASGKQNEIWSVGKFAYTLFFYLPTLPLNADE